MTHAGALENLILETILKIPIDIISRYTTVPDQIIFLVLIPHIILFLFIYAFSASVIGRTVGAHSGLRNLLGVATYIFIIWSGWYGSPLISLFINWFQILLVIAFVVFFISIMFHPARGTTLSNLAGRFRLGGGRGGDDLRGELEKELQDTKAELRAVANMFNREEDPKVKIYYKQQVAELNRKIARLEQELENL